MKYKKVNSLAELKKIAASKDGEYKEFFIALGGGLLRSSKRITYFPPDKTFSINNEIDDSYQEDLTEKQLKSETNIYEAIEAGAFYQYIF